MKFIGRSGRATRPALTGRGERARGSRRKDLGAADGTEGLGNTRWQIKLFWVVK